MLRLLALPGVLLVVQALVAPPSAPSCTAGTRARTGEARLLPGRSLDSILVAAFARGRSLAEFLDGSSARLPEWYASAERTHVPDSTLARARSVGGRWRLLVVAADTCGDSLRQVPIVARLAELVHGLTVRIITPTEGGRAVQAQFRSLDGRQATPTYVLLDESGKAAGCIVELPEPLRHFLHARRADGTRERNKALADSALAWYTADAGASIVDEVVRLLEGARAGTPVCERGT
jgi:hypothetical protein